MWKRSDTRIVFNRPLVTWRAQINERYADLVVEISALNAAKSWNGGKVLSGLARTEPVCLDLETNTCWKCCKMLCAPVSRVQRLTQHMSPFKTDANTYPDGSHWCPWQPLRGPSANHVLHSPGLQAGFPAYKKGVSAVHLGGSKCVNTDTHGCGDLVWQEYTSFLAGYCEGGYSCWLWLECKQNAGSGGGRVCETDPWAAPKVLLVQRKGSVAPPITVTNTKTHTLSNRLTLHIKRQILRVDIWKASLLCF